MAAVVAIVKVEVAVQLLPLQLTGLGLNEPVAPAGNPVMERVVFTSALMPFPDVTVIEKVALPTVP